MDLCFSWFGQGAGANTRKACESSLTPKRLKRGMERSLMRACYCILLSESKQKLRGDVRFEPAKAGLSS